MRAPELRVVLGAKETYLAVYRISAPKTALGSLTPYSNSAFYHTNWLGICEQRRHSFPNLWPCRSSPADHSADQSLLFNIGQNFVSNGFSLLQVVKFKLRHVV
jgi:hypothetical protein